LLPHFGSLLPHFGSLIPLQVIHCMPAIINFSAVFLVVFAGMAFAHLLAYGDSIFQFKDATAAFYSMYRVLAGDFNFIAMYTPPAPTSIADLLF